MAETLLIEDRIQFGDFLQGKLFKEFAKLSGKNPKEAILHDTGNWSVLFGNTKDDKLIVYELYIEHYKCSPEMKVGFSTNLDGWYISCHG